MNIALDQQNCDCYQDSLTSIYNRQALLKYIGTGQHFTLFILDIDNFESVNNTYGYLIADEVLRSVAEYLKKVAPQESELFRIESDRFGILIGRTLLSIEMQELAQMLISFFNNIEVYNDEETKIKVFFSIGVYAGYGDNLLNYANMALGDARRYKKNSYKVFDINSSYIKEQLQNVDWITNVRKYIEDEKFVLFYQPIIDNKINKITKYECLVRIAYGSSFITPNNFMHACKVTGILELITRYVISTAFKKFADTEYDFSINITSDDINLGYLEDLLDKKSKIHNIEPSRVTLEILEDIMTLTEDPHILSQINSLRSRGFKIALDDFGTQNSNFSRLLDFKPDYIKIDGIFIKDLQESKKSQIIVKTIVDFCKMSEIEVIAEYVHSEAVMKKVQDYEIDYSQGYFIAEPAQELL